MRPARTGFWRAFAVWGAMALLFYLPFFAVAGRGLWGGEGRLALVAFLRGPLFPRVLGFTLWESLLSALGSVLLALPGAYFLGRYRFRGKNVLRSLLVLPFVLPSVLGILALVTVYGRNGLLNRLLLAIAGPGAPQMASLYGLAGIILAHVFFNFALGIRIIGEAWERLDQSLLEASGSLGADTAKTWRAIVLPLIWPAVANAFILAFIYSSLSFTIILIFGGVRFRTFEVLIYDRLNQDLDFAGAYAVAAVQMALTGGLLLLRGWMARRKRRVSAAFGPPVSRPLPRGPRRWFFFCYLLMLSAFFLLPLGGLLARALSGRQGTGEPALANFGALFGSSFRLGAGADLPHIVLTSLGLALTVGILVTVLAYLLSLGRGGRAALDAAVTLPLGASLVTVCFGLLSIAGPSAPPILLIVWAQILLGLPFGFILLRQAQEELGASVLEAAQSLGACRWRARIDIEIPLLKRTLLTVFAYGAAFSLGDVAAVMLLGQGRVTTMGVAVYKLMGHYRFPQALALGVLLLFLSLGLFLLIDRKSNPFQVLTNYASAKMLFGPRGRGEHGESLPD